MWAPAQTSFLAIRVGDPLTLSTANTVPGTALPVYFDYFDKHGQRWLSRPVRSTAGSGQSACTLSFGDVTSSSLTYWLDREGFPSLASETGSRAFFPCHNVPVGSSLRQILAANKTIAVLDRFGNIDTSANFIGFNGARGTQTGLRQVVSADGISNFWVLGIANTNYGLRYMSTRREQVPPRVYGSVFYTNLTRLRYQAASLDARGVALYGGQLYLTSSWLAEPNQNMDKYPATPW